MSSVNSKETVHCLVDLQRIDNAVHRVEKRLRDGPALVERRGEKYRLAAAKLSSDRDKIQLFRANIAQTEIDLKAKEAEIEKIRDQQQGSRTNQEYRALEAHVERIQAACKQLEDEILDGFSKADAADGEVGAYSRRVDELAAEHQVFVDQWAKDEAEYQAESATLNEKRSSHAGLLPKDALLIYERVLKARDGEAVAPAEGKVCGGCLMALLPNDLARLHGAEELVSCNSCSRILYIPGVHDAS